jgi:hypothetical protein
MRDGLKVIKLSSAQEEPSPDLATSTERQQRWSNSKQAEDRC